MSEENNYTIWSFLKKCHDRGLVYRAYDSMPWCPRCAVGISQMEMHEGYQLVAARAVFVRFPLRGRPGRKPARLDDDALDADQQRRRGGQSRSSPTSRSSTGTKSTIWPKALSPLNGWKRSSEQKEWVEGVPKLKTLEQIFKEKGGYEVVGELAGSEMLGWTYDGPFDELPAQNHPGGYPRRSRDVAIKQQWGPSKPAREIHRVIAWDAVSEAEGTGIVHIAPGCGKEDFALGKEEGLVPIAPLDEAGIFLDGFGELERQVGHRSRHRRLDPRQPAAKGTAVRRRSGIRTAIRTAGAARRSCSSASSMSGSSTCDGVTRS